MKKKKPIWLAASLLVFMVFGSVNAVMAQLVEVTNAQLVSEAQSIVRGDVTAQRSEWNDEQTYIWTFVSLTVTETLKGDDVTGQDVQIKIPNGTVGEITQMSSDQVVFGAGEDVVVFMGTETYKDQPYYNVVRMAQGKMKVNGEQVSSSQGVLPQMTTDAYLAEIRRLVEEGGQDQDQ